MARLVALHPSENKFFELPVGEPKTIGRKGTCHLVEQDLAVSGHHCTVVCHHTPQGIHLEITDSSSNGTFINDRPIGRGQSMTAHIGDIIDLAKPKEDGVPIVRYRVDTAEKSPQLRPVPSDPARQEPRSLRDRIDELQLSLRIETQRNETCERKLATTQEALHNSLSNLEIVTEQREVLQLKLAHSGEQQTGLRAELESALARIARLESQLREAGEREHRLKTENENVHEKITRGAAGAERLALDFNTQIESLLSTLVGNSFFASTLPDPSPPSPKRPRLSPVSETSSIADLADMLDIPL